MATMPMPSNAMPAGGMPPRPPMSAAPPPPAGGGSPADRAARAMEDAAKKQMAAIDATYPRGGGPVSTKDVQAVSEAAVKAIEALGGNQNERLIAWQAPKGVREIPGIPEDVYRMAMLILLMAVKVLPPEKAGQFTVVPEDFTTDKGLSKIGGMLAQIGRDKKLQKLIHEGVAAMGAGGPPTPEAGESEPNPDKVEPPHPEPDADEDMTAV